MKRRTFLAGTTASVAFPNHPSRIGSSDVTRTRRLVDQLSIDDQSGVVGLESRAIQRSESIRRLIDSGSASQRVRSQLYALAAESLTTGAWAAIDGRATTRAQQHLDRAVVLAGLSGDASAVLCVWHNLSMVAAQQGRNADALAATTAARGTGITRRDPLYASLCHARAASCHARLKDRHAALRSLGHAEEALTRAEPDAPRPSWIRFYNNAELHGLTSVVHLRLGRPDTAEYHAHRTLAALRPEFVRNRLYYTAHLALCQLQQDAPELACATATEVIAHSADSPTSARVQTLLRDFRTALASTSYRQTRAGRDWIKSTMVRDAEKSAAGDTKRDPRL